MALKVFNTFKNKNVPTDKREIDHKNVMQILILMLF